MKNNSQRISLFSFVILILSNFTACRSTGPTQVGVLVRKMPLFGQQAVDDHVYPPGSTYFVMPLITDWYTFNTNIQNLDMVANQTQGDRKYEDELRFKTIDGNDIGLDVNVLYRIMPEKAHYILQYVAKDDRELRDFIIRTVARSRARDIFGELKTEEFYIAEERNKKCKQAEEELNKILNPFGVKIENISTKDYRFNPEYQKAIEDKKIADQKVEKFKSEAQASAEEYLKKLEQSKGQVAQMTAKADGEFARNQLEADAYFEQQSKRAEAIKAEGEAEAKGVLEMNKALAGSGGEVMVKLRMAEALVGKKIILLPNGNGSGIDFKSTDVNKLLTTYGAQKLNSSTQQTAPTVSNSSK